MYIYVNYIYHLYKTLKIITGVQEDGIWHATTMQYIDVFVILYPYPRQSVLTVLHCKNPTCPQPGFTLPRRQFVTLNRLRCGQARCAESLHRWGVIASPACPCGESHQTTIIVEECPLTAFPGGLQRLHQAGPDAVEWLSRLSLKL